MYAYILNNQRPSDLHLVPRSRTVCGVQAFRGQNSLYNKTGLEKDII